MPNPRAEASTAPLTGLLAGCRILIVDDEIDILELASEILQGARIDTASNHAEAKHKLSTNAYDVAVLDIMGVQGLDLLAEFGSRLPCVMLTGHALGAQALRTSIEQRAALYLPKTELPMLDEHLTSLLTEIAQAGSEWRRVRSRRWSDFIERLDFRRWFRSEGDQLEWWAELPTYLFLQGIEWLKDVPEPELRSLARLATRHALGEGAPIPESDPDDNGRFYIIRRGDVDEMRQGRVFKSQHVRHEGDTLGEECVTLQVLPQARYRARTDVQLLEFPHQPVSRLLDTSPFLARALVRLMSGRGQEYELSFQRQIALFEQRAALLQQREELLRTFRESIIWFFLMMTWILVTSFISISIPNSATNLRVIAKWGIQIVGLLLGLVFILYHSKGARFFGITSVGTRAAAGRAVLFAVAFSPLIFATRLLADALDAMPPGIPLFQVSMPDGPLLAYLFLAVPLQEVIHRGVIQTYVRELAGGDRRGAVVAVVFGAVVFAFGHLMIGPLFAFTTFVAGIFWGIEFEADRNVIGVILSHAYVGWFALNVLSMTHLFGNI